MQFLLVVRLLHPSLCAPVYMIGWGRGIFHSRHLLSVAISVIEEAQSANISYVYMYKKNYSIQPEILETEIPNPMLTWTLNKIKSDRGVCAHALSI